MSKKILLSLTAFVTFMMLLTVANAGSRINIDFGSQYPNDTPFGWNNIGYVQARTNDYVRAGLRDVNDAVTPLDIRIVDGFNSAATRNGSGGTTQSTAFSPASADATKFNCYIYEGDADHTVSIRVEDLNPNKTYNFGFFDSYMADGDIRRECKYIIGNQSVNLVPNYNVNNVAYINDVSPDANGQVLIRLDFGAAPEVANKVCGLAVMTIEGDFTPVAKVNVNFGYIGPEIVAGWNNVTGAQAGTNGFILPGLQDSESQPTTLSLKILDGFYSIRNGVGGTQESTAFSPVYPLATKNNMYIYEGDADHSVSFQIEGLTAGKTYKFGFFDSYISDSNPRRECKYTIGEQSTNLIPNYNVNNVAYINATPDENGNVVVSLDFGAAPTVADKVCGLAIMTIEGDLPYYKTYSRKINIDFGVNANAYSGWNNYVAKISATDYGREHLGYLDKLVDMDDVTTNVAIRLLDDFHSAGSGGTWESTAFTPYNPDATQYDNYIYESAADPSGRTGSFRIENLDPEQTYRFGFFDSYISDGDPRRECKYIIGNQSVNLIPNYNINNIAYIDNVVPDVNGHVVVEVTYGAPDTVENRVAGLGVLTIDGDNFDNVFIPTECGDGGTVYLDEDINKDCYINLVDFSIMCDYWMSICLPSDGWCDGADLDYSTQLNFYDLKRLIDSWLMCTDPAVSVCDEYWE